MYRELGYSSTVFITSLKVELLSKTALPIGSQAHTY